jgi:predicted RNA-binding protein associated with RNAse of E/G family
VARQTSTTITERKTRLDGKTTEFVCERIVLEPRRRAVLRYVSDREWAIADTDVRVPVGTVTVAHYWIDRPYNVYHWLVGGRTLAYYCNIVTDTRIEPDLVAYTDLVVDVLLRPSGAADVLDEDELPHDLAPGHRLAIAKALEVLIANPRFLIREIEQETTAALRRGVSGGWGA